jgi:hypothetical protein
MAIAIALDLGSSGVPDTTGKEAIYQGTLTFSGSYTTGGDTLSFGNSSILSNSIPNYVEVYEQPSSSQTAVAYKFIYSPGTTIANGKLQIFTNAGSQFAAGAYSTTFATTVVKFRVWFGRGA